MKSRVFFAAAAAVAFVSSCAPAKFYCDTQDQVAIVAHRGYWNCEQAGYAQNSVAALRAAQEAGFWGSEFDVQMTLDGVVVSNHDKEYGPQKMIIAEHTYEELSQYLLPNGEHLPTLAEYLQQGKACASTMLVLEFKKQASDEATARLVDNTMDILKAEGLYDPNRVVFISFSKLACRKVAAEHPDFSIQYLTGDMSAAKIKKEGLSGADYNVMLYKVNPALARRLHKRGLKVNVWTIDSHKDLSNMIRLGVDQLTTNNPMEARAILGDRELKK